MAEEGAREQVGGSFSPGMACQMPVAPSTRSLTAGNAARGWHHSRALQLCPAAHLRTVLRPQGICTLLYLVA
jgi:hypothetical protein